MQKQWWEHFPDATEQQGGVVTKAADPTLPYKTTQEKYEAQSAPYEAQTAQANAARAQAEAKYAEQTAAAQAAKAAADAKSATAAAARGGTNPNQAFDNESGLRKEFTGRQEVQNYQTILPLYASALKAGPGGAGDLNVIYALGKVMDPGSVVREGELTLASNTGSAGEKLKGYYKSVSQGGSLTPEVRKQLITEIQNRAEKAASAYNQSRNYFRDLSGQYGIEPDRIIGQHPGGAFQQDEADYKGRPIRNLDGSTGAIPTNQGGVDVEIGFNMPNQPKTISEMNPEQVAAYDAFMRANPKATPDQLTSFAQSMGFGMSNAAEIVAFRDDPKGHGEWASARGAKYDIPAETKLLKAQRDMMDGGANLTDLATQGATFGWSDNAAGVANILRNGIKAPFSDQVAFDPMGSYQAGRDADLMRLEEARKEYGGLGTAVEFLSGFGSGVPGRSFAAVPPPQGLLGRMVTGGKAGAGAGSIAGAGYSDGGIADTATGAVQGGLLGATVGAGLPVLAKGARGLFDYAQTARGASQGDEALGIIGDSMIADDVALSDAFGNMRARQVDGVPAMLADTGDNTRGLMAASARHPGPGKTQARANLTARQEGLADRVSSHVERDLGPASNPHQISDQLMQQASTSAAPLYEQAYQARGVFTPTIQSIMQRPAMRSAMGRAQRIAAEEGRDPTALGFDLDPQGEVILTREPSMQTLDYIKRGLDDVLEQYRDPTSGRMRLDEAGKAIDGTRRMFLGELDRVNPAYRQAREAWGGPVRANQAMERGRKALNMTADDMTHVTRDMSPNDLEFFRLGVRRALTEAVQAGGDQADAVRKILGSGKKRAMLNRLFGGNGEFDRFTRTMQGEAAGIETNRRAMQGSPTDLNRLESSVIEDQGMGFIQRLASGNQGVMSSIATEVLRLSQRGAFGSGEAATAARQEIARILSTTDPKEAGQAMAKISKMMVREKKGRAGLNARAGSMGIGFGGEAGALTGN